MRRHASVRTHPVDAFSWRSLLKSITSIYFGSTNTVHSTDCIVHLLRRIPNSYTCRTVTASVANLEALSVDSSFDFSGFLSFCALLPNLALPTEAGIPSPRLAASRTSYRLCPPRNPLRFHFADDDPRHATTNCAPSWLSRGQDRMTTELSK